jgi:hypothetical protein
MHIGADRWVLSLHQGLGLSYFEQTQSSPCAIMRLILV